MHNVWVGEIIDYLKTSESYSPNISKVFDWGLGYYTRFKKATLVVVEQNTTNFKKKMTSLKACHLFDSIVK